MRKPSRNASVASSHFGPSFLDQHHPHFPVSGFAKHRSVCLLEHGYVVIDKKLSQLPLVINDELVDSVAVECHFVVENVAYSLGVFGQGGKGCQKIAIPDIALLDIFRRNSSLHHYAAFYYFGDSLPDYLPVLETEIQRPLVGRKGRISERRVFISALFQKLFVLGGGSKSEPVIAM